MHSKINPIRKRQGLGARSTIAEDTVKPNPIIHAIKTHCVLRTAASDSQQGIFKSG
jgi:hypothetical protein